MTIQAYVDETGLDGRSPILLFSALIGTAFDWASFSDQWKDVLNESPRIDYFKMDEAVGFDKQFYGCSESQRNYKLIRLAKTIGGEYPIVEHVVTADLAAIEKVLKPLASKPASDPYFWPFQLTIHTIGLSLLLDAEYDEPFEIFFDEHVIFGPRAKAWWPIVRALAKPELRAILPVEPIFRDDKNTMPLQAADLTAWMTFHDQTGTNEFAWLREHLSVGKGRTAHIGEDEIKLMYKRRAAVPPELQWRADAAQEAFHQTFIVGGARHYVPKPKKKKKKRKDR